MRKMQASKNGNTIQNFGYSYDIFGNLAARTEDKFAMPITETFTYDYLNRLTTVTLNGSVSSDIAYDAFGRILSKEADGQTVFSGAQYNTYDQHGNLKPHAVSSATMAGNPFASPSLDIAYTMFDKVKTLSQYDENENLVGQVAYQYGYDHERIQMAHGNSYEKLYVGNCELITQNGNSQWNTFISGPMGVFAAVTSNGTTESLRYIYKDHLGSWTTLTDDQGTVLQELSFDAWGNLRASASWSGQYNGVLLYDRGFTGHEHLFSFGLINMNGRMYDPVMSSFLSVDNYVQRPDFSQSFNRYAYCLNNPLRYTDPDGGWVQYVIGGLLGAWNGYSIGRAAGLEGWDLVWSTVGGAAVGAISGGIGTYVSSVSTAAVGGLCGGAISGAGNGLIQGLATDSKTLGADVLNGLWKGGLSGMAGGYVGGDIGIYGGKGAFLGGITGSLTSELFNAATIDGYKVNWLNVGMGGVMSYGIYHAQVFAGYMAGGFRDKMDYSDFCDMMSISQKSMREWKECKFISYNDGKKPYMSMGEDHSVSTEGKYYENANFDYHTHPEWPSHLADYDLMSTVEGAKMEGYPINHCDEAARVALTRLGCEHMYQGSRNGHMVYMTNEVNTESNVLNHFMQYRVPYNYYSVFHYYQHQMIINLKIR